MSVHQADTYSSLMMRGFGPGIPAFQQQQRQQQQQADDDIAALNNFLAVSSATAATRLNPQQQQPIITVNDQSLSTVSDQAMAAILASATSAYTDAQLAAMSGSASPLNLASIGVTPSQSFQASQLGDLSADAAALAATGFAGSSADNSIARTADVHDSLYSQSMSSLDAATLASMLASAGHSPYSPPSASGTFGLPLISEEPPSAGFLASPLQLQTQPLSGGYDQLHFVLGKRKADEFCSDMLSSTMGVPLSKRVSMPVYFGDRNAGAPNSSAIPVPIGIGMQRTTTYQAGTLPAASGTSFGTPGSFSFSIADYGNANPPSALCSVKALPISRLNSTSEIANSSSTQVLPVALSSSEQNAGGAPVQVQRKVAHNAIERRYRNNINDRICDLRNAVPALLHVRPKKRTTGNRDNNAVEFSDDDDDGGDDNPEGAEDDTSVSYFDGVAAATKLNKATILGKSTEYIYHLRRSNDQLKRESLYLQDVIQHGLTNGDNILALILQKAQQESAAATSLLHPPAREVRSKKK